MKKWLDTNLIAVRSPDRAERAILKVILAGRVFGVIQAIFMVGSYFVMQERNLEL